MSIIIPYNEDLEKNNGAFITQSGQIICIQQDNHEDIAKMICNNKTDNSLQSFLRNTYANNLFQDPLNESIFPKLTNEQLTLYKLWFENKNIKNTCFSDFLVRVLKYDKVERVMNHCITTSSLTPHIRLYNYYLMDWHIWELMPIEYKKETNTFEYIDKDYNMFLSNEDNNAYEEIEYIKKYVMKKERHLFFK